MKIKAPVILGFYLVLVCGGILAGCGDSRQLRTERQPSVATTPANHPPTGSQTPPVNVPADTPTLPGPPPVPPAGSETCYKAERFICDVELEIMRLTNAHRTESGKPPMKNSPTISFVARSWSAHQGQSGRIGHQGFPKDRYNVLQSEFSTAGGVQMWAENVAQTYASSGNAQAVANEFVSMWMSSRGHRSNMLGNSTAIGVGVFQRGNAWFATQIFGSDR